MDAGDTLEIHTGDPDWDAALAFSQKQALGSFIGASPNLPQASLVGSRQPDGGYSRSGTGTDMAAGWNGQSPFESYYAASLLPMAHELRRGLVENFLSVQEEDGSIDDKPGLAGQRAKFLGRAAAGQPGMGLLPGYAGRSIFGGSLPQAAALLPGLVPLRA